MKAIVRRLAHLFRVRGTKNAAIVTRHAECFVGLVTNVPPADRVHDLEHVDSSGGQEASILVAGDLWCRYRGPPFEKQGGVEAGAGIRKCLALARCTLALGIYDGLPTAAPEDRSDNTTAFHVIREATTSATVSNCRSVERALQWNVAHRALSACAAGERSVHTTDGKKLSLIAPPGLFVIELAIITCAVGPAQVAGAFLGFWGCRDLV